jgi:heptosyltransferase-1
MIDAKRICIVRLGGLGDVINTLPALDAVRAACPDARIAWLVEAAWRDVLPGAARLDDVISVPKREWLTKLRGLDDLTKLPVEVARFARDLRARKFDLVIDFHGNLRSGVAAFTTGAKTRVGYAPAFCKEFNYLFTNEHHAVGDGRIHRIDRALALAEAIGAERVTDTPKMDVREDALEFARTAFDEADLTTRPVVAIHPGTSRFGAYKRWPVESYNQIVRALDHHGFASLITWGPDEYEMVVAAAAGTHAVVAPRTRSVADLAALLSLCDAFIGADTGPGLVAAAVDTPPVSIFGPKDPVVYAPRHARARVVELPMACRPCRKRTCDDPTCVLHITVGQVADAALALLSEMEGN